MFSLILSSVFSASNSYRAGNNKLTVYRLLSSSSAEVQGTFSIMFFNLFLSKLSSLGISLFNSLEYLFKVTGVLRFAKHLYFLSSLIYTDKECPP